MAFVLTAITGLVALYFSTFIYKFIRNAINAKKTGFPSVYVPGDQNHVLWMITSVPLRTWFEANLPKWIYNRIVLMIYGHEFHERFRPFEDYASPRSQGKSYMLVTCGSSEFWTWDSEIAHQILSRPRDFQQAAITDLFMARFGHNLFTSNGDRWARQRKLIASVINERISKATFNESIRQTDGLLSEVFEKPQSGGETNKMFDMMKKITIHVLSGAGMGASVPWESNETEKPKPGFKLNYIEAVKTVISNVSGPLILPEWFLNNYPSFLPGYAMFHSLGYAVKEFPVHTMDMLEQERTRSLTNKGGDSRSNIMSQLLQASESDKSGNSLSEEEMMGNLFIFTAAGFDTTANTLSYATVMMARYPEWQKWLFEEIDALVPADMASAELEYTDIQPKAIRVLAFMLETLRLFTPLIHITKETKTPQKIQTSHGSYWLPANTQIYINNVVLGLDPAVFRNLNLADTDKATQDDELQFRPTRWLNKGEKGAQQTHFQPPKGAFLPWSAGPRVCPGQKMAQVEFTSVVIALLRKHKVEAVTLKGESQQDMEARLDSITKKSISVLTLQMDGVYDVGDGQDKGLKLRLKKR